MKSSMHCSSSEEDGDVTDDAEFDEEEEPPLSRRVPVELTGLSYSQRVQPSRQLTAHGGSVVHSSKAIAKRCVAGPMTSVW